MKKIKNKVIAGSANKPLIFDVFYRETNTPKPVIIFCHGYKGFKDWGAWNLMAEAMASDMCFVKFNFSHNGGTVEQPIDFPDLKAFGNNNYTKELDDLKAIIDWVDANEEFQCEMDKTNIFLLGHSRGGGIACIKAAEDSRITKIITLGGVSDFGARFSAMGDLVAWKKNRIKYVINTRTNQQMPHLYQFYEDFKANEERLTIQRAVINLKIPFCIVHGSADTSILVEEAENLKSWNLESELHIIPNANHVFGTKHPWENNDLPLHLSQVISICKSFLKNTSFQKIK